MLDWDAKPDEWTAKTAIVIIRIYVKKYRIPNIESKLKYDMTNSGVPTQGMHQFAETIAVIWISAFISFVAAIIVLSALGKATFENIQIIGGIWDHGLEL